MTKSDIEFLGDEFTEIKNYIEENYGHKWIFNEEQKFQLALAIFNKLAKKPGK
jgi:hypothetical protein